MLYKDDELPFLDALFAGFDHENGVIDRTGILVYADFMEENGMPESPIIRALGQLDGDHYDHKLLKEVHALNHRQLFDVIEPEVSRIDVKICDKAFPLNVIVNGWKTDTIAYFPPVKEDRRMLCFVTKTLTGPVPKANDNQTVLAGTWTEIWREVERPPALAGRKPVVYGTQIEFDPAEAYCPTVPGYVKKAMIVGYLNHVRKDSERKCGFGPPKQNKRQRKKVADAT